MFKWMKKLHMYAGLLSFAALTVWGVAGIHGALLPPPGEYRPPEPSQSREIAYEAPGNLDDPELARIIFEELALPLGTDFYNIHRDDASNLAFYVFTVNGRRDVTYFEERQTVRVVYRQNPLAGFLSGMHTRHSRRTPPELAPRLWAYYNEISTWAFLFMTVSGVYMWIATRPGMRWAQLTFAGSALIFIALWVASR